MSQAAYIRDMMVDPGSDIPVGPSEVANFYAGRNVFLTGGTGFLGKLLTERILRSCPNINTLFMLLRRKKGKSPEERFKDLFDDVIFDRLKKEQPGYSQKVVLIEGDMMQVGLGLSPESIELLRSTHIVIHGAATVRFDEKLRIAVSINVRGIMELLSFAKQMLDLKAFVHISTAYSNCVSDVIEEKFYPPPIDSDKLLNLIDILDDASLDHLTPVLVGKWPNTYVFTKAVAEDAIRRNCQRLPLCIVRPSIVIATSKEPIAGWVNNVQGATGILVGASVCLLRTLHCDGEKVAGIIPADYVVNSVIVAAWDIAKAQSLNVNSTDNLTVPEIGDPPIYNVVTSCQKPITWGKLMEYTEKYMVEIPSMMCIWYFCLTLNKYRWVHNLYVIFLHLIPAAIVDIFAWLTGRKPILFAAYTKINKLSSVLAYFALQQWRFHDDNLMRLWEKLGPADRNEFDLDIGSFDWEEYSYRHVRGLRIYVMKDPLDTIPQGRARYANSLYSGNSYMWYPLMAAMVVFRTDRLVVTLSGNNLSMTKVQFQLGMGSRSRVFTAITAAASLAMQFLAKAIRYVAKRTAYI